jgi:hypothetical protein
MQCGNIKKVYGISQGLKTLIPGSYAINFRPEALYLLKVLCLGQDLSRAV